MRAVVVERDRIGDAAAREREPRLPLEIVDLLDRAQRQRMLDRRERLAVEKARLDQAFDVAGANRSEAVAHAALLDLDQRLEPQHAARAVAHDLDRDRGLLGRRCQEAGDLVGTDCDRSRVAGHEHA